MRVKEFRVGVTTVTATIIMIITNVSKLTVTTIRMNILINDLTITLIPSMTAMKKDTMLIMVNQ